ncbi:Uncharacterised protein [Chlamydia trachomatis]|nr:Uncharacterised protein [Chlamydia trachomatis]
MSPAITAEVVPAGVCGAGAGVVVADDAEEVVSAGVAGAVLAADLAAEALACWERPKFTAEAIAASTLSSPVAAAVRFCPSFTVALVST